jgi:acyl-CoA synthetase (AMP-forming)/AMP-acid ligase II
MILISGKYRRYDLSSLQLITYGTEPMSAATLRALTEALPGVQYKQTYGLTEAGILPTKSQSADSVWMKMGGQNYETKIVDDVLWIRSDAMMLGYLNAPSPFCPQGWLNTGDKVEVRGEYVRILGRESEMINVGGEKLYPMEVEELILQVENISDVVVSSKPNAITGRVVVASVQLIAPEDPRSVEQRVRRHCRQHLAPFKVPAMVSVTTESLCGSRFKKRRILAAPARMPARGPVDAT